MIDRAIALGKVNFPVSDMALDAYPDDGWGSIFFENPTPPAQVNPSVFLDELLGQGKRLLAGGWSLIRGYQIIRATPTEMGSTPCQKSIMNKEYLTCAGGVLDLDRLEGERARARTFLGGEHRPRGYSGEDWGTILALCNILTFQRAETFGCFEWEAAIADSKSKRHIVGADREAALEMVQAEVSQETALSLICKLLGQHWGPLKPRVRRNTVRRITKDLQVAGYLDFYSDFEPGVRGQNTVFTRLDVVGLLVLHEQAEEALEESFDRVLVKAIAGIEYEVSCSEDGRHMPGHKANSGRVLFNALFPGAGYRREHYDDQPEDWDMADEFRETAQLRTNAAIAQKFLKVDLEFEQALRWCGEGHAKTVWLRRQRSQLLDRYRWLEVTLEDYKGHPEAFDAEELGDAARSNGRWYRLIDLWEERSGSVIENLEGVRRSLSEFKNDCLAYALEYPRTIGRLHFDRVFG